MYFYFNLVALIAVISILFLPNAVYGTKVHRSGCKAANNKTWSYHGKDNGEKKWNITYPDCSKKMQSPIAIDSTKVIKDENLEKLTPNNYNIPISKATILNDGYSIQVNPTDGVPRSIIVDGSIYSLNHFHFHWGLIHNKGSEHTLDGVRYAMEIHIVHFNAKGDDAEIAVLFEEIDGDENSNAQLDAIIGHFDQLKYEGDRVNTKREIKLDGLLPPTPFSYYRYKGSFTRPPCTPGAIFSVLPDTMTTTTKQMEAFRNLIYSVKENQIGDDDCRLVGNIRHLQSLDDRKVYLSQ